MIGNSPDISLLHPFSPSETALLDWLEPHIDDSLLHEIAAADYGMEAEEHFKALKQIRDQQNIPVPLLWVPREVLELMRWSEPEDPAWKPGSTGTRGHLMRAFSCAVLLKAADVSENETLVRLIASVLYLGREASECALRFLCWRVLRQSFDDEEAPFFTFALLLLRVALFEPPQDGAGLSLLTDWIIAEEARARAIHSKSADWLLGLTSHDQRHDAWRKMANKVLLDPTKSLPEPAATALQNIVNRLVGEPG